MLKTTVRYKTVIYLFRVEETFNVEDAESSLVLVPDLPLPDKANKPIRGTIIIKMKGRTQKEVVADISLSYFENDNGDFYPNYVVTIPHGKSSEVPTGSEVWIGEQFDHRLKSNA